MNNEKILMVTGILTIVVVLIMVSYFGYREFIKKSNTVKEIELEPIDQDWSIYIKSSFRISNENTTWCLV